jgi:DNA repair protein RadD
MQLREYQTAAVDAIYQYLAQQQGNPVAVLPTGSGKTPLLATLCSDVVSRWGGRVLVVSHVKELLQQQHAALQAICPDVAVGMYSAGLNSRETNTPVVVAGIQSVYRRAAELGRFDLIIVDEAHLIPLDGEGMYRQLLAESMIVNPQLRVVGLTATPYRLKDGLICDPDHFLNDICYEVGVAELIDQGFLCPLVSKGGTQKADLSGVHVRGGEYMQDELEDAFNDDLLVGRACGEIAELTADRRSVLIFTSGVQHGMNVAYNMQNFTARECGFICGDTDSDERARTLARFKSGELKYLSNVNVLTTGFDAPNVDCVVLLRATLSPGLYYQMVGRGFRLHEAKENCIILDYGDNIIRHGPVDAIRVVNKKPTSGGEAPMKECENCHEIVAAGHRECPECGHEFPPPENDPHATTASDQSILSKDAPAYEDETFEVTDITYSVHTKRGAADDAPRTMRVTYSIYLGGNVSEWVCIEHTGWARSKAVAWWAKRTDLDCPDNTDEAVELADAGHLQCPHSIVVRTTAGKQWPEIAAVHMSEPLSVDSNNLSEVPF